MADQNTKKMVASAGIFVAAYNALAMHFTQIPPIPYLDNTMIIAAGGAVSMWAIYMLWKEY